MKKHLTKLVSLGLSVAVALSLSACGGDSKSDASEETRSPVAERGEAITGQSGAQENLAEAAGGVTLSQWLGSGETIWYVTETPVSQLGKDTEVETILLLGADGTACSGDADGLTLGELAQMEEAEIAELTRETYNREAMGGEFAAYLEEDDGRRMARLNEMYLGGTMWMLATEPSYGEAILSELKTMDLPEGMLPLLEEYVGIFSQPLEQPEVLEQALMAVYDFQSMDIVEEVLAGADPAAAEPIREMFNQAVDAQNRIADVLERSSEAEPGRWALSINTDRTGNNTESMTFAWSAARTRSDKVSSVIFYASSGAGQTVYDVLYGGVDLEGGGSLVTRVDGAYSVILETPDSGLPMDVEPEELFS